MAAFCIHALNSFMMVLLLLDTYMRTSGPMYMDQESILIPNDALWRRLPLTVAGICHRKPSDPLSSRHVADAA